MSGGLYINYKPNRTAQFPPKKSPIAAKLRKQRKKNKKRKVENWKAKTSFHEPSNTETESEKLIKERETEKKEKAKT